MNVLYFGIHFTGNDQGEGAVPLWIIFDSFFKKNGTDFSVDEMFVTFISPAMKKRYKHALNGANLPGL